jgi:tetratricopeptide (TPR) repeat protein
MKAWGRVMVVLGALALTGVGACTKEPDPAAVHQKAGDQHYGKGEWKQAAEEYGRSLEVNPKQPKVWEKKAEAHRQDGNLAAAEEALVKTVDYKTDAAQKSEVYRSLANLYVQKSYAEKGDAAKANDEKAEKLFSEAVKVDPKDDVSLSWLGEIYARRGGARDMKADAVPEQLNKAMEYYDKVIAIKPELPATYINKRIVVTKYKDKEMKLKQAAEEEAKTNKDKDKAEAAKKEAEQHQARMDELQKQFEELTKKYTEAQKAAAAASAAAAAAPKPTQ